MACIKIHMILEQDIVAKAGRTVYCYENESLDSDGAWGNVWMNMLPLWLHKWSIILSLLSFSAD